MKILIAEDDVVSRKVLVGHLEKWGYEVMETTNGTDAWNAFEAGDFQMAILDWMMPGMDGVELVRCIRLARRPTYTYVILLTAKSQKEDIVGGFEAGADDYVTKPFDREELRVRVLAGQRILQLQSELLRAEKAASVGQIALGISHELSEPIARVRDNLGMLRRRMLTVAEQLETPLPPATDLTGTGEVQTESTSDLISQSIDLLVRAQDTLRNLRDFAHADEFIMKPIALAPALHDVYDMIRRLAEAKAVDVMLDIADVPAVNANAGKLKKVVLHLMVNAIDAVDRRGTVVLRASHEDGHVVIRVMDNGRGIAPAHLPHLFEPFYCLRLPADRRLGLGLAISDAIVREHGGSLDVQSIVDRGTTFIIRLPAVVPEVTVSPAVHAAGAAPRKVVAER